MLPNHRKSPYTQTKVPILYKIDSFGYVSLIYIMQNITPIIKPIIITTNTTLTTNGDARRITVMIFY